MSDFFNKIVEISLHNNKQKKTQLLTTTYYYSTTNFKTCGLLYKIFSMPQFLTPIQCLLEENSFESLFILYDFSSKWACSTSEGRWPLLNVRLPILRNFIQNRVLWCDICVYFTGRTILVLPPSAFWPDKYKTRNRYLSSGYLKRNPLRRRPVSWLFHHVSHRTHIKYRIDYMWFCI